MRAPLKVEADLNIFGIETMSVSGTSSTPPPLPFNYLDTNTKPAAIISAVVTPDSSDGSSDDNNDASTAQPPALPPLPPGQGTRVDQLV